MVSVDRLDDGQDDIRWDRLGWAGMGWDGLN